MANEAAKARERWQMRLLSTTTMSNELLSTRTMANELLSTRTMAEDGDKHKNDAK
jgi:hypothetical protein